MTTENDPRPWQYKPPIFSSIWSGSRDGVKTRWCKVADNNKQPVPDTFVDGGTIFERSEPPADDSFSDKGFLFYTARETHHALVDPIMSWKYRTVSPDVDTAVALHGHEHIRHIYEAFSLVCAQEEGLSGIALGITHGILGRPSIAEYFSADAAPDIQRGWVLGTQALWSILGGFDDGQQVEDTPPPLEYKPPYDESFEDWVAKAREARGT